MFQQVIVIGNVGKDPEFRYTPQGIAVADFSVAVSKKTGKGEDRKEKTTWFKVTVWRERAETVSQYVKKGMKIMVIGEVEARAYIDKNNQPQATLELTANDFKFLDSKRDDDQGGEASGQRQRGPVDAVGGGRQQRESDEETGDIPF